MTLPINQNWGHTIRTLIYTAIFLAIPIFGKILNAYVIENSLYVNENVDHSNIRTILIIIEDRDSLVIQPTEPEIRILIQDWIPPEDELLNMLNFKWADGNDLDISEWENYFLENGYNVVDRNYVDEILEEQSITLLGLNDQFENAEIAGADAILVINKLSISSNLDGAAGYEKWRLRLIATDSGEIIMSASFFSMFGRNSPDDEMLSHHESFNEWKSNLIRKYKSRVAEMSD